MLLLKNNPAGFELGHKAELGDWEVPGGRNEAGESDEVTLKREIKEETNLDATMDSLISDFEFSPRDDVIIRGKCYQCTASSRDVVLENLGRRHSEALWLTFDEALERTMPPWLRDAIMKLKNRPASTWRS
jgi:8-oxo-dGTP pyrophosphatase MutT (NUDIX family)